jgi:hypothetical protein
MIIIEESELQLYINDELKKIANGLGRSYIDNGNSGDVGRGSIKVGEVTINITYKNIVTGIRASINFNNTKIDCTKDIDKLTRLSEDCQTASMIIKSIQESNLMSINDITR